jgi:hypothetical protein
MAEPQAARGSVVAVRESVVDVRFSDGLPAVLHRLEVKAAGGVTLEVVAHLSAELVRAIALKPTTGLYRGARLIEPVADPSKNYEFCKGFYSRISPDDKVMRGRVTRLFVAPFLSAMLPLMRQQGFHELEQYFLFHQSFRYALAGEFCMSRNLAMGIDISYDWGLEVGTLSQVYENLHPRKIAQVDLDINYEHKHQPLSDELSQEGLHRMVMDISRNYLNVMRAKGFALSDEIVDVLQNAYLRAALDAVRRYADDASINQLVYDRYSEEQIVQFFQELFLVCLAAAERKFDQHATAFLEPDQLQHS